MDQSAHVTSIDAIRALQGALSQFEGGVRDGLEMLVLEVRRAVDWIEDDRRRYWPAQVRQASEKLSEARNELERCQLKYGSEEGPSCYEQKKSFERAKRRLRGCEEKVKVTKRWIRTVRQEVSEFEGKVAQLSNCLDSDVPRAIAALERMLQALEKYTATPHLDRPAGTSNESEP